MAGDQKSGKKKGSKEKGAKKSKAVRSGGDADDKNKGNYCKQRAVLVVNKRNVTRKFNTYTQLWQILN